MGIEYYAFALFIAALISIIAILFRLLFANVRRQHKILDEKENKLLQMYRSIESITEDFNDQIAAVMEDIKEYENRTIALVASMTKPPEPPAINEETPAPQKNERPAAMTVDSSRIRAAGEVLERAERMIISGSGKQAAPAVKSGNGEVIQKLFDEPSEEQYESTAGPKVKLNGRGESILALAGEGKTHAQIARELGITQNEVKLVIGINGQR
jgi:type II secretory pathway component PulJ